MMRLQCLEELTAHLCAFILMVLASFLLFFGWDRKLVGYCPLEVSKETACIIARHATRFRYGDKVKLNETLREDGTNYFFSVELTNGKKKMLTVSKKGGCLNWKTLHNFDHRK